MLSIKPLVNAGATVPYFVKEDGAYGKESLDQDSQWVGQGAARLGLTGPVTPASFRALLEGKLPTGQALGVQRYLTLEGLSLNALVAHHGKPIKILDDLLTLKLSDGSSVYKNLTDAQQKKATAMRFSPVTSLNDDKVGIFYHRPGWDFTFSAPKSVSVLAEVGGDQRIMAAHTQAVKSALDKLESHGVGVRQHQGGALSVRPSGNLVAALFRHDTSRALDPQLHTHAVIMNLTQRQDGQWKTLESQGLFDLKMTAGLIYRAQLAAALSQLGYAIEPTHDDGRFEVTSVPPEVIQAFSQRRQQIEAALKASYVNDANAAARVALTTRTHKIKADGQVLRDTWKTMVQSLGFDAERAVQQAVTRSGFSAPDRQTPEIKNPSVSHEIDGRDDHGREIANDAVKFAAAKLGEREAVFSDMELLTEALKHSLGHITVAQVDQAIRELADDQQLIHARLNDDRGINDFSGETAAWTTREAVYLESSINQIMKAGQGQSQPIGTRVEVIRHLETYGLTQGQTRAARLILQSKDRVIGVQGYAGTGKTYLLQAVRALADTKNIEVKGFAPSATAANTLEQEAGIESQTIAKHLIDMKRLITAQTRLAFGGQIPDLSHQLWVVDEASMKSNRDMYALLRLSAQTGAKVVLIGDIKQLPSVEAGKPFQRLQHAGMRTAVMDQIQRQKDKNLKAAVHHSMMGDANKALDKIADTVYEIPDKATRLAAMAQQYLALSPPERALTFVLSPANDDRQVLNQLIREGLQAQGGLGQAAIQTMVYEKVNHTRVEKARASGYKKGNVVRFGRNYRSLGVEKGEYTQVLSVDKTQGVVTLQKADGSTLVWKPHQVGGNRKEGGVEIYQEKGRELSEKDQVRWHRNDKARGLRNAEAAQVKKIDGKFVTFELTDGSTIKVDITLAENRHWDHAYAATVYAAQGGTVNQVLVNGESWRKNLVNQKSFYVALSRAKYQAHVYVDDKKAFMQAIAQRAGDKTSALEAMDRSQAARSKGESRVAPPTLDRPSAGEKSGDGPPKESPNKALNTRQNRNSGGPYSPKREDGQDKELPTSKPGLTDRGLIADTIEKEMASPQESREKEVMPEEKTPADLHQGERGGLER